MNVIELAKEAGFDIDEGLFPFEASEDKFIGTERTLEAFAALVRAEVELELINKLQKSEPKTQAKELNSFEREAALVARRIDFMRNH